MRLLLIVCVLLRPQVGEAADLFVTYHSAPEGATLIENGTSVLGSTPVTVKYTVPRRWTGCLTLKPMKVRWISGAEASLGGQEKGFGIDDVLKSALYGVDLEPSGGPIPLMACASDGKHQVMHVQRPTGIVGLEIDVQYAGQIQQLALLQQQIALQRQTAYRTELQQQYAATQQQFAQQQQTWFLIQQQIQSRMRTVRCYSNVVGFTVITNCY